MGDIFDADDDQDDSGDLLLASFDRSAADKPDTDQVRVLLREYNGKKFIDVRAFFRLDERDKWKPTKRGISVRVRELDGVIRALERARDVLGRRR